MNPVPSGDRNLDELNRIMGSLEGRTITRAIAVIGDGAAMGTGELWLDLDDGRRFRLEALDGSPGDPPRLALCEVLAELKAGE